MTLVEHYHQKGFEKGLELGNNKARLTVANSMLNLGFSPEVIAQVTELSIEQIYLLK